MYAGAKLQQIRIAHNMSAADVAKAIGSCTAEDVQDWESNGLPLDMVPSIAACFGTVESELLPVRRSKDPLAVSIGKRIAGIRESKGLSMSDVAAQIDKRLATYGHYETGYAEMSLTTAVRLAKVFDITVSYLVGEMSEQAMYHVQMLEETNDLNEAQIALLLTMARELKR